MEVLKIKRKCLLKPSEAEVKEEPKKPRKSNKGNTLPPDEYKDEIPPKEIVLNEDGKLIISVKRGGPLGLPRVDIRYFATTDVYCGFTKKGVNFDLAYLPDLMEILNTVTEECDVKKLFEEFQ